ncbi:hypothetical protein IE980_01535 [Klebsiella pneumoniae]|nr:hypothetical protein [Klebsiella pneumoniae]MBF6066796.1 hypothetical protein [Klebsiella pneumoniae]
MGRQRVIRKTPSFHQGRNLVKQTHYFTVNFTGFTTAASEEQSYLRLIAGEHAFIPINAILKTPRF